MTEIRTERPRFDSREGLGNLLFTTASRPALGLTPPPIQWVPGVKRSDREADHSLPSRAEVKNTRLYISIPSYVFMSWCLVKHGDNFVRTFILRRRHTCCSCCQG